MPETYHLDDFHDMDRKLIRTAINGHLSLALIHPRSVDTSKPFVVAVASVKLDLPASVEFCEWVLLRNIRGALL